MAAVALSFRFIPGIAGPNIGLMIAATVRGRPYFLVDGPKKTQSCYCIAHNDPASSQQNMPSHDMSNMKGMSMGTDKEKDKQLRSRHKRYAFDGRPVHGAAYEDDGTSPVATR
jgi:hypothetical protein